MKKPSMNSILFAVLPCLLMAGTSQAAVHQVVSLVNPAGKVIIKNQQKKIDASGSAYVDIGNGFHVFAGEDGKLGTNDDIVKGFGHYPQDDITGAKVEPLDWRLLDIRDHHAILIANVIVDAVKFNNSDADGNEWATSNLRMWLNSKGGLSSGGDKLGFLNRAFDEKEKGKMVIMPISMASTGHFIAYNRLLDSNWWQEYSTQGQSTKDYVWALSGEEVYKYFGKSKLATQSELGHSPDNYSNAYYKPSAFAKNNGVKVNEGGNGPSFIGYADVWTRSKGAPAKDNVFYGVFLGSTGSLNSGRPVTRDYGALPVIAVKLN